ncbi:hypothetical protein KIL84_003156 [Mauremys mutica]|uniref:Uncharacterized protein n=1 Tax=Mauremys mutica TaxID=74926 RepID=A0A9D3WVZ3_9SAUR|nr:hypothetical protein KIL84_003156 [Mauremys mutica]
MPISSKHRFLVMVSWASVVDQPPSWTIRVSSYPWDFEKGEYLQRLSLARAADGARVTVWHKAGGEVPWRQGIIRIHSRTTEKYLLGGPEPPLVPIGTNPVPPVGSGVEVEWEALLASNSNY